MSIKMEFSRESVAGFQSLIREMEQFTKQNTDKVLRNTARDFGRRAMFVTPRGPKTIEVQGASGKFFKRATAFGFAKAGWVKALQRLGVSTGSGFIKGKRLALRFGDFVDKRKDRVPSIEIANQIPYIEELDQGSSRNQAHNIMFKAMEKTARDMDRRLSRMADRMQRKWKGL